jgi:deoxyribonuclease-4
MDAKALQIFRQERESVARPPRAARRNPRVQGQGHRRAHRPGGVACKLPDQPGLDGAALRELSLEAMGDELDRAESLGLLGVVLHPGCYTAGSEDTGLRLIADGLLTLLRERRRGRTMVLLEHTAGQGTSLGWTFEQLATIIARTNDHRRVGVCLDTCHLLASGYDICSPEGYAATFTRFGRTVGFDRLRVFHLNDSKRPLASRVDRHEHIGEGCLGLEPFRRIVNDRRFRGLPMLLETPKEASRSPTRIEVDRFDAKNLATLRSLVDS